MGRTSALIIVALVAAHAHDAPPAKVPLRAPPPATAHHKGQGAAPPQQKLAATVLPPPAPPLLLTTACTGNSTKLPADQCAAWIKFYDGTNGDGWKIPGGGPCTRHDPCACKGFEAAFYPVCNPGGTTVINM